MFNNLSEFTKRRFIYYPALSMIVFWMLYKNGVVQFNQSHYIPHYIRFWEAPLFIKVIIFGYLYGYTFAIIDRYVKARNFIFVLVIPIVYIFKLLLASTGMIFGIYILIIEIAISVFKYSQNRFKQHKNPSLKSLQ